MRRTALIGFLLSLSLLAGGDATASEPGSRNRCGGQDLLPEVVARDRDARQRIGEAAAKVDNGEAMLWRIDVPGRAPSHLFGTIHVTDPRVTTLSPKVAAALDGSAEVALEVADLSPQGFAKAMGRVQDALMFRDGRSLAQMLDADELKAARAVGGAAGLPDALVPAFRPWVITMLLAVPGCERARMQTGLQPLDFQLGERARAKGRPVTGLETLEDQFRAMARVPEADQLVMLKTSLKTANRAEDLLETIIQRYLAREVPMVWAMQLEMARAAGFDPAPMASFHRELIVIRNHRMREAALPLMQRGGAFVAVGALHLVGDEGLVALLRRDGLSVVAVE